MITNVERFRPASQVYLRELDRCTVLMDLKSGAYFGLDSVAGEIWQGLILGRAISEIVEGLELSYDADGEMLLRDVRAFVEECLRLRVLVRAPHDS